MFNEAYDTNPPKNTHQRENATMHDVFKKVNVPLTSDKVCNVPRLVDVNRTEMHGGDINSISRLSNHGIADKLNSSHMTQVPERMMHCNSGLL